MSNFPSHDFPPDTDNSGWVKGWGVFQNNPWRLASLYLTKEEAEAEKMKLGNDYQVAYGSHCRDSDDFIY